MSDVLEADADLKGLCKHLSGKTAVAIEDLPRNFQSPGLLAKALHKGFMEIGRQSYSESIASLTVKKEKGSVVIDSEGRQVIVKEMRATPDNAWNWTNLSGPNRKPFIEVLAEDKSLPDNLKLHVRLTTAGLAVS